jgi:hypothetical protein
MQQWNFGIQRELGHDLIAEIAYAGSKGTGLPGNYRNSFNQLDDRHLALGSALTDRVPNPLFGQIPTGPLASATVERSQLLRPYPHFANLYLEGEAVGHSNYHSMQAKLNKRFGSSLAGLTYTLSKGIGDVESRTDFLEGGAQNPITMGYYNVFNRGLDRSLNLFDSTHRLVVFYSWELPFGNGRSLANSLPGALNAIVSGWQLTGVYTAQSGTPIPLTSAVNQVGTYAPGSRPNNNGKSANLSGNAHSRLGRWFDTSVFSPAPAFTYGTTGRVLPDVRNHGINSIDFGLFKNNYIGERFNVQLRAEFFNLLNRVQFNNPGLTEGTGQFGVVSAQRNNPRQVQLAIKLIF